MHPIDPPNSTDDLFVGHELGRLEEERDELSKQVEELLHTKDSLYEKWRASERELAEIHRSKMWRIWIASIDLRHKIRHPFALLTKAADAEPVSHSSERKWEANRVVGPNRELISPASQEIDLEKRADRDGGLRDPESESTASIDVSVVIPTLNGGEDLERCLEAIFRQSTERTVEILCVDSGSNEHDLDTMSRLGARIVAIDRSQFNHGLTRDLGARLTSGSIIVFLNQDAVPAHEHWLEELVSPFDDGDERLAARPGWDSRGGRPRSAFLLGFVRRTFLFHLRVASLDRGSRRNRFFHRQLRGQTLDLAAPPIRTGDDHGGQEVAARDHQSRPGDPHAAGGPGPPHSQLHQP